MTATLVLPASAQAATEHWATNWSLSAKTGLYGGSGLPINGAYCHELDPNPRQIEINGVWASTGSLYYASWANVDTEGLRSFPGTWILKGACYNPHTVSYLFNAHVNY